MQLAPKLGFQKHWAVTEYERFFPGHTPSCFQQSLIEDAVSDIGKWKEALTYWAGNNYRPQSIQKMLDYYGQITRKQFDENFKAPPPTACGFCGEIYCLSDHHKERQAI